MRFNLGLIFVVQIFCTNNCFAQENDKSRLFDDIKRMDRLLFTAVNNCDTAAYQNYFTKDLEFYHDKGGVSFFDDELASIKARCRSGVRVRRVLILSSLKVYPIKNYGAIQEAEHTFYFTDPGKPEQLGGTFKFLHIWKFENNSWKISRVISYGH